MSDKICQPCEGTGVVWARDALGNEIRFVCPTCAGNGVPFPLKVK